MCKSLKNLQGENSFCSDILSRTSGWKQQRSSVWGSCFCKKKKHICYWVITVSFVMTRKKSFFKKDFSAVHVQNKSLTALSVVARTSGSESLCLWWLCLSPPPAACRDDPKLRRKQQQLLAAVGEGQNTVGQDIIYILNVEPSRRSWSFRFASRHVFQGGPERSADWSLVDPPAKTKAKTLR